MLRTLALCACFALAIGPSIAWAASWPIPHGTFVQEWYVKNWTDSDWLGEYARMKELGMKYLILQSVADSKRKETVYPTRIPGYRLANGYSDAVGACLRNAEKSGIRVFIGLNTNPDWWRHAANDPAWLAEQMQAGNHIAAELNRLYGKRYPHAFYGWYWTWEVDNLNYKKPEQQRNLAKGLDISLRGLHALKPRRPVMLSPFVNPDCGPASEYEALWKNVFAQCSLGKGDIFCPQDGLGGEKLDATTFLEWMAGYRRAVDTKPGLALWSNAETFCADGTSATMDRIAAQCKNVRPYVSEIITFSYSHYQSERSVGPGFHDAWLHYVKTGKLQTADVPDPTNARYRVLDSGKVRLNWDRPKSGVCAYAIFRNGVRVARVQLPKRMTYLDSPPAGATPHYTIQAYDWWGNRSAVVDAVPDTSTE